MKLKMLVEALQLKVLTENANLEAEVSGGYASDLLSNVMGQAEAGMIWITMQGHQNIVAIASLLGLAAIVVTADMVVEADTLTKAEQNDVVILTTALDTYEVAGRLYALGVKNS